MSSGRDAVTGAFGYTGGYVAERLLAAGRRVVTLTGHPGRPSPLQGRVEVRPLRFDRAELAASLAGVDTLYSTYWVRFGHGGESFERAVANSRTLFEAAAAAGVRRVVHVSIAQADPASDLPYYRGKGRVEEALKASVPSWALVRPTVLFGGWDILLNNIAWMLRRFPVYPLFEGGRYPIQPVAVEDVADVMLAAGAAPGNVVWDAAGPERYAYEDMIRLMAETLERRPLLPRVGRTAALALSAGMGLLTGDRVLTGEEIDGLTRGLLRSDEPARGTRSFRAWLESGRDAIGREYRHELKRHFDAGRKG